MAGKVEEHKQSLERVPHRHRSIVSYELKNEPTHINYEAHPFYNPI